MFQVKVQYDYPDFLALNRLMGKTFQKLNNFVVRPAMVVLGLALAIGSLTMLIKQAFSLEWVVYLVLGVVLVVTGVLAQHINAKKSSRMIQKNIGEVTFTFNKDAFEETNHSGSFQNEYRTIAALYQYEDRYFLFTDKRHAYILPIASFVQGDAQTFTDFISQKCGKPWRVVK